MSDELIQYVRKPGISIIDENGNIKFQRGEPYGCLVATLTEDDTVSIGWSMCSPNDQWNREYAKHLAIKRSNAYHDLTDRNDVYVIIPQSLTRAFDDFIDRAMRYFQTDMLAVNYAYEFNIYLEDTSSVKMVKLF